MSQMPLVVVQTKTVSTDLYNIQQEYTDVQVSRSTILRHLEIDGNYRVIRRSDNVS